MDVSRLLFIIYMDNGNMDDGCHVLIMRFQKRRIDLFINVATKSAIYFTIIILLTPETQISKY